MTLYAIKYSHIGFLKKAHDRSFPNHLIAHWEPLLYVWEFFLYSLSTVHVFSYTPISELLKYQYNVSCSFVALSHVTNCFALAVTEAGITPLHSQLTAE